MLGQHSSNSKSSNNTEETRGPKEEDSKGAIHTDGESRTSYSRCSPPSDDRKKRGVGVGGVVEASQGEWGRERLKRHRRMAMEDGQVRIPDEWSQETLLGSWIDCSAFQTSYVPIGLAPAREALARECLHPATSHDLNRHHIHVHKQ